MGREERGGEERGREWEEMRREEEWKGGQMRGREGRKRFILWGKKLQKCRFHQNLK